jgi:hypothetical protein
MSTYPAYIHAWTQSDRLALAMNFQERGFDFFHPATYNLLTKDGITQVDFPIHDYLVALISSISGWNIVSVFRTYTLLYSLIGLFFFFRLCLLLSRSPMRSIGACAFLFTLPFYVYYQNGFLPSAPSFANFLIGIYFIAKSWQNRHDRSYILGSAFLTLAALARAPFLIFLLALLFQELWRQWRKKKWHLMRLIYPLSGIALFIAYYCYNQQLAQEYGSMFLSEWLFFDSLENFIDIMGIAADRWGKQVLSPYHALLLLSMLATSIWQLKNRNSLSKRNIALLQYFLIALPGVLCFFFAFGKQFADHDYYYIDSFLPLLTLLLILLLTQLKVKRSWYTPTATICGIFFIYFFTYAREIQEQRYTPPYNDRIEYAYQLYQESGKTLKDWGVQPKDTLFVLEANSTNMPFTLWKNRGYTNLNSAPKYLAKQLDSNFTYAVLIDSFFVQSTFKDYPEIIKRLKKVKGNGQLSLYTKDPEQRADNFFDQLIYYGYSDFDGESNMADSIFAWTPTEVLDEEHGKSLKVQDVNEYTATIKRKLKDIDEQKAIRILLTAEFQQADTAKLRIVSSLNQYYAANYLENQLTENGQWKKIQYAYLIPPGSFKEGDELGFYFWNPEKDVVFVDNIQVIMYQ